jgi:hypothetical protein
MSELTCANCGLTATECIHNPCSNRSYEDGRADERAKHEETRQMLFDLHAWAKAYDFYWIPEDDCEDLHILRDKIESMIKNQA